MSTTDRPYLIDPGQNGHDEDGGGVRVALYSHDTMGLGHLRRNLLIAHTLAGPPVRATNLLITGAHEANFFRLPERADCLTLPRLRKNGGDDYAAGQLRMSLDDLVQLRGQSICSALQVFRPDVLIVDKVPTGAFNELAPALKMLSRRGTTKCVLGLRDVLDDSATVAREWLTPENVDAVERYYDSVWVYGDAQVFDPVAEYGLPASIARRIKFTGYIDQSARVGLAQAKTNRLLETVIAGGPFIACLVGGGQDGAAIARTFIQALPPRGVAGVVVTGPLMPPAAMNGLAEMAARRDNVHLIDFVPEADMLIERAERVVSMAGYNTVCSLLSFQKIALLVPRVDPRTEQRIRAERLHRLGFVDMVLPDVLTVAGLRRWLLHNRSQPPSVHGTVDFAGLTRLTGLTEALIAPRSAPRRPHALPHTV